LRRGESNRQAAEPDPLEECCKLDDCTTAEAKIAAAIDRVGRPSFREEPLRIGAPPVTTIRHLTGRDRVP
jgi:hypothetical protein